MRQIIINTEESGLVPEATVSINGYRAQNRTREELLQLVIEDLIRGMITTAPGNKFEVLVNGNKVDIGGETPEWLRKIIEPPGKPG